MAKPTTILNKRGLKMESCYVCLFYHICNKNWQDKTGTPMPNLCAQEFVCEDFKDKTKFVELPRTVEA